jgi:hypothetical protein
MSVLFITSPYRQVPSAAMQNRQMEGVARASCPMAEHRYVMCSSGRGIPLPEYCSRRAVVDETPI